MACSIDEELFSEYSITKMRALNTKALIVWEQGNYSDADDIFDYIIGCSEKMSDDYLIDVADFELNYARCLHEQENDTKAKVMYDKCISIWTEMSDTGNRKLCLAHQEFADILFSEGNVTDALKNYNKTLEYNTEDFYVEVDTLDSIAACLILLQKTDDGIQKFIEVLTLLVDYKVKDADTKYKLCNNLLCILDAESDEEKEIRFKIMEQIEGNEALTDYVNNFLIEFR